MTGTSFDLVLPGRRPDAETLLSHPATGRLFVGEQGASSGGTARGAGRARRRTGPTGCRAVGDALTLATDGAFFPDGRHLVVRNYDAGRRLHLPRPGAGGLRSSCPTSSRARRSRWRRTTASSSPPRAPRQAGAGGRAARRPCAGSVAPTGGAATSPTATPPTTESRRQRAARGAGPVQPGSVAVGAGRGPVRRCGGGAAARGASERARSRLRRLASRMPRLRRTSPDDPGWTRRRAGKGFVYLDEHGERLSAQDARSGSRTW